MTSAGNLQSCYEEDSKLLGAETELFSLQEKKHIASYIQKGLLTRDFPCASQLRGDHFLALVMLHSPKICLPLFAYLIDWSGAMENKQLNK